MKTQWKRICSAAMALTMAAACTGMLPGIAADDDAVTGTVRPLGTYEAEELDVTESQIVWTDIWGKKIGGEYSGEGFVYQTNGTITAYIEVDEEGMYSISAKCAQIESQDGRMATICVNGADYTYNMPYLDTWTDINFGVFRFKKGVNTIIFKPQYGYQEYDTITFEKGVLPELKGTSVPCDPNATPETKSLLSYLNSVYGKSILSGQQEIYGGGHEVQTSIRYDAATNTCKDEQGVIYTFDESEMDVDKDGNPFPWHCTGPDGQVYEYNTQNRNYKYNDYDYEIRYLEELTGTKPAIRGFDFGSYCPCYAWNDGVTQRMIDWGKNNGIVTASWHINVPTRMADYTLGEPLDFSLTTYTENTDFVTANCLVEGTVEYEYFKLCVENLANELLKIQDAGIPVIFRPFHEAEGNGGADGSGAWFWWAKEGAEVYNKLWIRLYEMLTEEYGLHNLIWEQNLYAWSSDSALWYTGDDYVDIVGFDKYNTVYNRHDGKTSGPNEDAESKIFYSLVDYVDNKKMVAMPENSTVPSKENLEVEKAYWLYFCIWYDSEGDPFVSGTQYQNADTLKAIYQSDLCLTLDELPEDLYTGTFTSEETKNPEETTESGEGTGDIPFFGDVNEDGEVTIVDVVKLCRAAMGADTLSDYGKQCADVDLNGVADATDASYIIQSLVGLVTLPVGDLGGDENVVV